MDEISKNKKTVLLDAIAMYAVAFCNLVLPLIFIPFLAKKLGLEKFGIFAVIAALYQYASLVVEFGTNTTLVRYLTISKEYILFTIVLKVRLLFGIVVFLFVIFLQYYFTPIDSFTVIFILIITLIGTAINPISIFQSINKLPLYSLVMLFSRVLVLIITLLLLSYRDDVWIAVFFQFTPIAICTLISLLILKRKGIVIPFNELFTKEMHISEPIFKESISIFTGTLLSSGYTLAIPLIINSFYGVTAAGIFGLVDRVLQPLKQMMMPLMNILYPRFCELLKTKSAQLINKTIQIIGFLGGIVFVGMASFLFLFSEYIYKYLFNSMVPLDFIYPMAWILWFIYLSQLCIYLLIMPLGFGYKLKYAYFKVFIIFVIFIYVVLSLNEIIYMYYFLMCIELISLLLVVYLSRVAIHAAGKTSYE